MQAISEYTGIYGDWLVSDMIAQWSAEWSRKIVFRFAIDYSKQNVSSKI